VIKNISEEKMRTQRKSYTGDYKAKIVVEAIKGQQTINQLASKYGVHPNMITEWKKQALAGLPQVLSDRRGREEKAEEELKAQLYQQIGQLKMELTWLKKKAGLES
jgi:putative transposase